MPSLVAVASIRLTETMALALVRAIHFVALLSRVAGIAVANSLHALAAPILLAAHIVACDSATGINAVRSCIPGLAPANTTFAIAVILTQHAAARSTRLELGLRTVHALKASVA